MNTAIRGVLIVLGVGTGLFGAKLLLDEGTDNLIATAKWLVGGVVLHDGIIGPVTILVAVLAARVLKGPVPAAVIVGALVIATVTVVALPVLGKPGLKPDNPTLLDRNYAVGWVVFVALTMLCVAAALVRDRRRTRGVTRGAGPGGR